MICNVGGIDRIVRVLVAIVLISSAFLVFPNLLLKSVAFVIAGLLLLNAWMGFCYVYKLLGVSTAARPIAKQ